jgi:RNA polymerase sigma-70 factor (ECF subfamily)
VYLREAFPFSTVGTRSLLGREEVDSPPLNTRSRAAHKCGGAGSAKPVFKFSNHSGAENLVTTDTNRAPYSRDPDVQLMLRAKQGDEEAFSQLVAAHEQRLINNLRRQVHDAHTAEDLAQEVFLRVYGARSRYQPTARFTTWLFRIASNLASNARRDRRRRREVPLVLWESGQIGSSMDGRPAVNQRTAQPESRLEAIELQRRVRSAIGRLGGRQQKAVVLQKYEQKSCAEIGMAMQMTPVAVKSLLSRARENLRDDLEAEFSSPA